MLLNDIRNELDHLLADLTSQVDALYLRADDHKIHDSISALGTSPCQPDRISRFSKITFALHKIPLRWPKRTIAATTSELAKGNLGSSPVEDGVIKCTGSKGSSEPFYSIRNPEELETATIGHDMDEEAAQVLARLAPLVAGVQRLTPRVLMYHGEDRYEMCELHLDVCKAFSELFRIMEDDHNVDTSSISQDEDDLEMRALVLTALGSKVRAEQTVIMDALNPFNDHASLTTASTASTPSLAANTPNSNPFVRHSIGILKAPSSRCISTAKSIILHVPLRHQHDDALIRSSPDRFFVTGSPTSTWRANVLRLGSFQASALFTPSPIAVRRIAHGEMSLL